MSRLMLFPRAVPRDPTVDAWFNVGFFLGSSLDDPAGLLEGTGKWMRHVKIHRAQPVNDSARRSHHRCLSGHAVAVEGVIKAASVAVAISGLGVFGAAEPAAPVAMTVETAAYPSGVATLPNDPRLFLIADPPDANTPSGSADSKTGLLVVYDDRDLSEVARVAICARPRSIVANGLTKRLVIACDGDRIAIVDAQTLEIVSTLSGLGAKKLRSGGLGSPYAYALTGSGVAQLDTRPGTLTRMFAPPGMSTFADFSVSTAGPESITLYDDARAITQAANPGLDAGPAVDREFGRLRFPNGNVSADGAQIFVLSGAGSLVRVGPTGSTARTPICETPIETFWNIAIHRLLTFCFPQDTTRIEAVSTNVEGSEKRLVSLSFRRAGLYDTPRVVSDSASGRFAIGQTNTIHVIDPSAGADLYTVRLPGDVADLAIDASSGDVFAAFRADQGGGIERFNLRSAQPVIPPHVAVRGSISTGDVFLFADQMSMVTPPARLDPPGIRSPAQIAPLADGSFLVRELLSPRVGRLRDGVYTEENLLAQAPIALIAGLDGNTWFLELVDGTGWRIARREPNGRVTEFHGGVDAPQNIVASGDGLYWIFGSHEPRKVGHLTYDGRMSVLSPVLPKNSEGFVFLTGITGDRSGGFFLASEEQVIHYNALGKVTRNIPLQTGIADGFPRVWSLEDGSIAAAYARKLLVIDGAGHQRVYYPALGLPDPPRPADDPPASFAVSFPPYGPECRLTDIALGPRASIWGICDNAIVDIEADGKIRRYHLPYEQSSPASLVRGPDGSMWFAETTQSRIGRITPSGQLSEIDI